ncbi:MAG: putative quorum-sensing-regulated virulence factor [Sodalis sp. (in: enterobacteria)]
MVNTAMPFGKYQWQILIALPESYVLCLTCKGSSRIMAESAHELSGVSHIK